MNVITVRISVAEAALLRALLNAELNHLGALPAPCEQYEVHALNERIERAALLAAKLAH